LQALKARNFEKLEALLVDNSPNKEDTKKLKAALDAEPALWDELARILRLGGGFASNTNDRMFHAPYTNINDCFHQPRQRTDTCDVGDMPADTAEGRKQLRVGYVVAAKAAARAEPRADAPVVATLSYNVVTVLDWSWPERGQMRPSWVKIELPNKKVAYLPGADVRSAFDTSVHFYGGPRQANEDKIKRSVKKSDWKVSVSLRRTEDLKKLK